MFKTIMPNPVKAFSALFLAVPLMAGAEQKTSDETETQATAPAQLPSAGYRAYYDPDTGTSAGTTYASTNAVFTSSLN